MPPIYEFTCSDCKQLNEIILDYEMYDKFESAKCPSCGSELTKKDRVIGSGLKTTVKGVRKGQYNSNY